MKLKKLYLFLLFTFAVQFIHAQINPPSLSNLRKVTISTKGKTVKLDSLSLVPGSVIMDGVSPYYYKVDEVNATVTLSLFGFSSQVIVAFTSSTL